MCGIAGFVGEGGVNELRRMTCALIHRGPDAEGQFAEPGLQLYLGHRRLAIIDLASGHQPMSNENDTVLVVFNGEIYNHRELRRELEADGHVFKASNSDTEVLVHGYEQWGLDLLPRLNGMFAFAIADISRRELVLARDRFGEKPLYYSHQSGLLAFSSELGSLTAHPRVTREIDGRALQKLFAYGYIPAPAAFYKRCAKLPAGGFLRYRIDCEELTSGTYWRFALRPDEVLSRRSDDDLAEELWQLLRTSVSRRLMSDVPIGVFLSGGVDSSAIVAAAAECMGHDRLSTFTVGFTERSYDESAFAREVAEAIGTRHHMHVLNIQDARALLPTVLSQLDEPLGDASIIPTYLLSKFTRQHVTVALSGDGGDELFAGYDPFAALQLARCYSRLVPPFLNQPIRRAAGLLPQSTANMSWDFKIRRALAGMSYPETMWNPVWMAPVEPARMGELFEEPLPAEELYDEAIAGWQACQSDDIVDRTLEFYTNLYLQNDILTKVDRAAMMVSLESRAVFLDNDLVEFCMRLPNIYKYRRGTRKYLLKRALSQKLPASIIHRRKKGFGIPLTGWLREMADELPMASVPGMRLDAIDRAVREHKSGRADHRFLLWNWWSVQGVLGHAHPAGIAA